MLAAEWIEVDAKWLSVCYLKCRSVEVLTSVNDDTMKSIEKNIQKGRNIIVPMYNWWQSSWKDE